MIQFRSILISKLVLCLLGFALLFATSHTLWSVAVLLGTSLSAYGVAVWLHDRPACSAHRLTARWAVPCAFALLVLLNVAGLVGTLTGVRTADSVTSGSALVAMPFYLLSCAAFTVDVALRRIKPSGLLDFLVYTSLPFKLLAGPLEPPRLLAQIRQFRLCIRRSRLRASWAWIALGAFMKYVVANRLDPARHLVSTDPLTSLATAAVFELKFYFDFAGYSFIGFGAARMLGLRINQNFDHPFLASNVVLFWRSWHISLGRFLGRYVLEPNLALWRGRSQKLIFASTIFMVSAMWHGGTLNYLFWGLFHGGCYYAYGHWFRRWPIPAWLGSVCMLLFFVVGRMFAIDSNGARLLVRLGQLLDPWSYAWPGSVGDAHQPFLVNAEPGALLFAGLFICLEMISVRRYPKRRGYHLFRRPWMAFIIFMIFVFLGVDTGNLLYARI